jgi:hypothetical protein
MYLFRESLDGEFGSPGQSRVAVPTSPVVLPIRLSLILFQEAT